MRKLIIPYLLVALLLTVITGLAIFYKRIDFKAAAMDIFAYCFLFGVLGGIIHCLRGYYLHSALLKDWNADWNVWYYLRPIVSGLMGFVSLIFIKAGLLMFSADSQVSIEGSKIMAYFAVAFIAGYNVQNFLAKLEEVFKAVLGIEKINFPKKGQS